MHFLETYLASSFYVALPLGIVASPGSTVLFTGKLMLLLLVYIREDAVVVRQPIYGLLVGNLLLFALAAVMRNHDLVELAPGRAADLGFLDEMGALMVWGTAILFLDCILIILLYERSRAWLGDRVMARLALAGAAVLTFDQVMFYAGLHVLTGAGLAVLFGGWAAKMGAVALYSVLGAVYLRWLERPLRRSRRAPRITDVFDTLTYRERYEELLARTGRDALTGALDRGRLEAHGRQTIDEAALAGRQVEPAAGRYRSFQELQRPLRPRRRRRRAQAHRRDHHDDRARGRSRLPLRRRGVRGDLRQHAGVARARARRAHPPRDCEQRRRHCARQRERRDRDLRAGCLRLRRAVRDRRPAPLSGQGRRPQLRDRRARGAGRRSGASAPGGVKRCSHQRDVRRPDA